MPKQVYMPCFRSLSTQEHRRVTAALGLPFSSCVPERLRIVLATKCFPYSYSQGSIVLQKGSASPFIGVIVSGVCRALLCSKSGTPLATEECKQSPAYQLNIGEVFGTESVFMGLSQPFQLVATTTVEVLLVHRLDFETSVPLLSRGDTSKHFREVLQQRLADIPRSAWPSVPVEIRHLLPHERDTVVFEVQASQESDDRWADLELGPAMLGGTHVASIPNISGTQKVKLQNQLAKAEMHSFGWAGTAKQKIFLDDEGPQSSDQFSMCNVADKRKLQPSSLGPVSYNGLKELMSLERAPQFHFPGGMVQSHKVLIH